MAPEMIINHYLEKVLATHLAIVEEPYTTNENIVSQNAKPRRENHINQSNFKTFGAANRNWAGHHLKGIT